MGKYNTLGSRIKECRQSLSLSQAELAQQLHCTQAALSLYESGNREPGLQELIRIASVLNTSTDYLLGITHIKSTNTDIKTLGDYLGLNEESISELRKTYMRYKECLSEEFLKKEVKLMSGSTPGDKNYEQEFSYILKFYQLELADYIKFINDFICSSAFKVLKHRMTNNLFIERTVYDILRVASRQYNELESALIETDIAANAYGLVDDSDDLIQRYSLNLYDTQMALHDFCKNFTQLESIKEMEYQETFYRKVCFSIYGYTHSMFVNENFSFEKLDEFLKKDAYQVVSQAIKLLKNKNK